MVDAETIHKLNLPRQRLMATGASFWKRSIAFIIDFLLMDLIFFSSFKKYLIIPETNFKEVFMQNAAALPNGFLASAILMGVIALLYFSLMEYYLGYTIGKQILGLRVVGKKGFVYFLLRNAFTIPIFPFTLFWIIEPIMLLRKKPRVLEQISQTQTIEIISMN